MQFCHVLPQVNNIIILGRSTALVFDSGAYSSSATTVHDGFALGKTTKKCPYGGETFTKEIERYIEK